MWRLSAIQGRKAVRIVARQGSWTQIQRAASTIPSKPSPIGTPSDETRNHRRPRITVRKFYSDTRVLKKSTGPPAVSSWNLGDDEEDEELDRHNIDLLDVDPEDPDDIPDLLDHRFRSLDDDDEDDAEEREQYRLQQESINDELDQRKGRPWKDPWEISEDQWMQSDTGPNSIPDWSPSLVSRIAQERLQVLSVEGALVYCCVRRGSYDK